MKSYTKIIYIKCDVEKDHNCLSEEECVLNV